MDYGSIICKPKNPDCLNCKIEKFCLSYKKNIHFKIPVKIKTQMAKPKKYTRAYVLVNEKNEILVRKRPSQGMLASMLEIPNDKWVEKKNLLQKDILIKKINRKFYKKGNLTYSFSHFDLETQIYYLKVLKKTFPQHKWLDINKYTKSQLPTVMKKIVEKSFLN